MLRLQPNNSILLNCSEKPVDKKLILAQKYATAFLNQFFSELSIHELQKIDAAVTFFKEHKNALFYLTLNTIDPKTKYDALMRMLTHSYQVTPSIAPLIKLLTKHKRTFLLPLVLHDIYQLGMMRHNQIKFEVSSAQPLTQEHKIAINTLLTRKTGANTIITYRVDPTLIAGFRAQSETYLFEQSIKKYLSCIAMPSIV